MNKTKNKKQRCSEQNGPVIKSVESVVGAWLQTNLLSQIIPIIDSLPAS